MASSNRTRILALLAVLVAAGAYSAITHLRHARTAAERLGAGDLDFESHPMPALETALLDRTPAATEESRRNPFTFGPPPTPTRDPRPTPTPAPTSTPVPRTPPPTATPGPPPPPPFTLTYIGHLGPNRLPVAVFRNQDKLEVAVLGAVIADRFILREVGLESVTIGFVGYPEEVSTRVPLAEN